MTEDKFKDVKFREVTSGQWKPEVEGDNIIGVFLKTEESESKDMSARHYLDTNEGLMFAWGSTVLDGKLDFVKPGTVIKITYLGKEKNDKGREYKDYKVEQGFTD